VDIESQARAMRRRGNRPEDQLNPDERTLLSKLWTDSAMSEERQVERRELRAIQDRFGIRTPAKSRPPRLRSFRQAYAFDPADIDGRPDAQMPSRQMLSRPPLPPLRPIEDEPVGRPSAMAAMLYHSWTRTAQIPTRRCPCWEQV